MNKTVKIILGIILLILLVFALKYFKDSNAKEVVDYKIELPFYSSLDTKTVATGKLNPEEEIELKPQISGIVDQIFVEEGDLVRKGDLIAKIRVVPNEQALVSAKSRITSLKLSFENAKTLFNRNKTLFEKVVITKQDFENSELSLNQSEENYSQSKNDYQIIKSGSSGAAGAANTNIYAQMTGTILEIPVKEGDQVIQSNNFNAGTTIASIADMNKMIFEGKVDESEVGKINVGMKLILSIGAIDKNKFDATLTYISPKGIEENGAIQFEIKADVILSDSVFIRSGYSANADIVLDQAIDVLTINEKLIQFEDNKPFVEVEIDNQEFEKSFIETGISDGINIHVLSGITLESKIKSGMIPTAEFEEKSE